MLNKRESACFRSSTVSWLMLIGQPRNGLSKVANTLIRIDMILDEAVASSLLALVKAGRQEVALVASRPSDLRTVQIKGGEARLQPFQLSWLDELEQGVRGRRDELAKIEFGGSYAATLYHFNADSLVCLRFDASAVYEQTPGPKAGQQLAGTS